MKRRVLSIIVCVCMTLLLIPASALAAGPEVKIAGLLVDSADWYAMTDAGGTVTPCASTDQWNIRVETNIDVTVTLRDAIISNAAENAIYVEGYDLNIALEGSANHIGTDAGINDSSHYAILSDGQVFLPPQDDRLHIRGLVSEQTINTVYGDLTIYSQSGEDLVLDADVLIDQDARLTVQEHSILKLHNSDSITINGQIINEGKILLPYAYTVEQIENLNLNGKIWLYDGVSEYKVYENGTLYPYGADASSGFDFSIPPGEETYYEAGFGYIIFRPATQSTPITFVLHEAYASGPIVLPSAQVTLTLQEKNDIRSIEAFGALTIDGLGTLDTYTLTNSDTSLNINSDAELNTKYQTTSNGVINNMIYGNYGSNESLLVGSNNKFVLTPGAVLDLSYGGNMIFYKDETLDSLSIETDACIVNNTYITLPEGTSVADIQALPLSGTGVVRVALTYDANGSPDSWNTYTNEGLALAKIKTGDIDLSVGDHSGATLQTDGYTWDDNNSILTLGNVYMDGDIYLPPGSTINTTADSIINGGINTSLGTVMNITFTGSSPLGISGNISAGANDDSITVRDGAQVTVTGDIFLGGSGGQDGSLKVTGVDTMLKVLSLSGYAVSCDTVIVEDGASLIARSPSTGTTMGISALEGGVTVTGGSTLTSSCDYGIYIIGGKLTVDATSTLITNGSIAPFCIEDATSAKAQSGVMSLPGIPGGTLVASVKGGSGTYWSLVPTGGNLGVSKENSTPVLLSGAGLGSLTFKTMPAPVIPGGNIGGKSYGLTFETNSDSVAETIYISAGRVVDLGDFAAIREDYKFDGWYADADLVEKASFVKMIKNITVYAKWIDANPFTDVFDDDYYRDAVQWAFENDITSGTTSTTFSPNMISTRAQAIAFLWRIMDRPEATLSDFPFDDVSKEAYYYEALLWAIENGITVGTSPTTFSPDATLTRSQAVTLLWRMAGNPIVTLTHSFTDVSQSAYYYNAMLWAVEQGITQGMTPVTFAPDYDCSRGQIVTFFYRYAGK